MTVATTDNAVSYAAPVADVPLAVNFPVFAETDLKVFYGETGLAVAVLNVHYTVTLAPPEYQTAQVTPLASLIALLAGAPLTIVRDLELLQTYDIPANTRLQEAELEKAFDKLVMIAQQIKRVADAAIHTPAADGAIDMVLPRVVDRASKVLGFDALGKPTLVAITGTAGIGAVVPSNVRPPDETVYTLQSSDNGATVIITNITNPVLVHVPVPEGLFDPFECTIMNTGSHTGITNVPVRLLPDDGRTIGGWAEAEVTPYQSVKVVADGDNWQIEFNLSVTQSGRGMGVNLVSFSPATIGPQWRLTGPVTAGDVVGFDYSWDGQPAIQFRHVMDGTANALRNAADDIRDQVRNNVLMQQAIGVDIIKEAPALYIDANTVLVVFNQSWPFVVDKHPVQVAYKSAGATETVTAGNTTQNILEAAAGFNIWHSAFVRGRAPQIGDYIGGIFATPDNTTLAGNLMQSSPIVSFLVWQLMNNDPNNPQVRFINNHAENVFQGGQVLVNGYGTAAKCPVIISNNATALPVPPGAAANLLQVAALTGSGSSITVDAFGASSAYHARRGNGNPAAITALLANDLIASYTGIGATAANTYQAVSSVSLRMYADENWSAPNQGARAEIWTTPKLTNATAKAVTFFASGGVGIGTNASDPGKGGLRLNANAAALPTPTAGTMLNLGNADATATRVQVNAFGAAVFPAVEFHRSRNTAGAEAALNNGDIIGALSFLGYKATAKAGGGAFILAQAAEGYTDAAAGTQFQIATTPTGSDVAVVAMYVRASGGISIGAEADPGTGGLGATNIVVSNTATLPHDLGAIEALTGTGIPKRTGTDTWAMGAGVTDLAATTADRLFGTNGTGVSGLITLPAAGLTLSAGALALANDLAALEALSGTGIASRSGANTWVQRSIAAATAAITITNGDGVSANPTVGLNLANANNWTAIQNFNTNAAALPTPLSGTVMQVVGPDANASRIELIASSDTFNHTPSIIFRRTRNTLGAPTAVAASTLIGSFSFQGWDTAAFNTGVSLYAAGKETWSAGARGADLIIDTTPAGSTTTATALKVWGSGGISVGGASGTDPGAGSIAMPTAGVIKVNNVQVLAGRDTGWSAMTGTTNKATVYDTATVTLPQLAGRMMAIQAALTTHGILGA